jgi:pantoate--beta-alanine ligase
VIHIRHTLADWRQQRHALAGRTIGFVPTMGALHAGHAALIERCRKENQVAVVSIFVNPSQFNDPKDLDRYPSTLPQDLKLLEELGVDEVILPTAAELYPHGYRYRIEPNHSGHALEGTHRPGFLQGVMTVVLKLLNLVRADRAYFGEKDYEQLLAVTDIAQEFFLPTAIIPCPTVREKSGLAMSSRNLLLPPEARRRAASIFQVLTTAANVSEARAALEAQGFTVEYVEERWGRRLAAVVLGGIRLIDNVPYGR